MIAAERDVIVEGGTERGGADGIKADDSDKEISMVPHLMVGPLESLQNISAVTTY